MGRPKHTRQYTPNIQTGKDSGSGTQEGKGAAKGRATKPLLTERAVCEYLKRECKKAGVDCFRMSSGVTRIGNRVLRFGQKGMADFLVIDRENAPVWVECKTKKGKLSADQIAFAKGRIAKDQAYVVLRGRDDIYGFDGFREFKVNLTLEEGL